MRIRIVFVLHMDSQLPTADYRGKEVEQKQKEPTCQTCFPEDAFPFFIKWFVFKLAAL